jgi:quercetin dioxygenase-like cupin family protein
VSAGYVRLYADGDGETHFEDVALATRERTAASGARAAVAAAIPVEGLIFRAVLDDGDSESPHNAPYPVFIITLAGEAEVTVSDGERRVFGPGSVVLVEDTTGRGHVTRPLGHGPRLTLLAPAGAP